MNDIIALSSLLQPGARKNLPESVRNDFAKFITANSKNIKIFARVTTVYAL